MSVQQSTKDVEVEIKNVGGIHDSSATFSPGITVLEGRNATNRTSFLQGIMAALGSDNVSIKGDADEARVELTVGDDTNTRTLARTNGTITTSGDPYLEDSTVADLFAFLVESNEARRAVTQNTDLREFIMRPVDTDEIQAEINQLVAERQELDDQIAEINDLKNEVPDLETEQTRLESEIAEKREELDAKEEELQSTGADIEQTQDEKQELEDKLDDLRELRSELDEVRYDIETERETLESLKTEKTELESTRADLPDTPAGELEEVNTQIERLRTKKQNIEPQVNELQSIISFNKNLLNEDNHEVLDAIGDNDQELTDQLVEEREITCWTCATTVPTEQIETTIGKLRDLAQQKLEEIDELESELDDLTDRQTRLKEQQNERDRVKQRLGQVADEIEESEEAIESHQEQRDELIEEIETVEAEVESLEDESYSEILELHREANQLEYDIGKLEGDLERVESEIADIESRLEDQAEIEAQRSNVQDEIADLRTRINRIEEEAVEAFNEHMDTVLDILDYANLERIWLERVEKEVERGRSKETENAFHLHVVRSTPSGTNYEDTIDHLSESEREVTGLVFALAGYLAHDLAETVPFMLLDSLEAIDSDRIATLIDYLSKHTEYLVVALLPEDAEALDREHQKIKPT